MNGKCSVCENYLRGVERCKFCSFEWATTYTPCDDTKWDIFELNEEEEWSFIQIQDRLKYRGIDCLLVLNWCDDNVILLFGCNAYSERIAKALNVHKECIVQDLDYALTVINLFMEKMLRESDSDV